MGQAIQMAGNTVGSPFVNAATKSHAEANAQATAMEAAADASNLMMQGKVALANSKIDALNYKTQAENYLNQISGFHSQAVQQSENRGIQLGQAKGNIVASAAGSGIDVGSRVVTKTLKDTTKSAYHDLETIAANEQGSILNAQTNAKVASVNAENALTLGNWENSVYQGLAQQTIDNGRLAAVTGLEGAYEAADNKMYATWLGAST